MKNILNLIGLAGFFAMMSGFYMNFGLANTLLYGGALLLLFAIFALKATIKGKKHA
ncbi:hypothetical protein U0K82_001120 [Vibrio metschnikovii]|nr:hypothetical protein [Vibrio metschnikovii]